MAVAGNGRVGIDAEAVRSEIDVEDLSRRFFAPAVAAELPVGTSRFDIVPQD